MFYEILSAYVFLLLFVVIKTKMGNWGWDFSWFTSPILSLFLLLNLGQIGSSIFPRLTCIWVCSVCLVASSQSTSHSVSSRLDFLCRSMVRFSVQVNVNVVCLTIKLYLMVCLVRGLKTRENFLWMNLRIKLHIELIHKNFPPFLSINQTYPSNYKLSYFQMFYVCLLKL